MTDNSNLKRRVRERAAKTGESYTYCTTPARGFGSASPEEGDDRGRADDVAARSAFSCSAA